MNNYEDKIANIISEEHKNTKEVYGTLRLNSAYLKMFRIRTTNTLQVNYFLFNIHLTGN